MKRRQYLSGCGSVWLEHLVWDQGVAGSNPVTSSSDYIKCRCGSMVEHQPSKLNTWVRFPSPALFIFPVKSLILRGFSLLLYSLLPDRKRVMASNSVFLHYLSSAILAGSSNPNTELTSFGSSFFGFLRS